MPTIEASKPHCVLHTWGLDARFHKPQAGFHAKSGVAFRVCVYIYISCWNARGPRFSHFSAAREPRNFWKNASYRRKKQMKSCEGAPDDCCEGAQKQVQLRRAPSQPSKFPGSFAAHETLLPTERAVWGSFSKHFRKPRPRTAKEPRKFPGSFAVLRVPQKEANLAKIACFEPRFRRKNAIQKCAKKVGQITPPSPQKERFFRVITPKKARFCRKNEFSVSLSKLRRKLRKWGTWRKRANPGKTSEKRSNRASHAHTRPEHREDQFYDLTPFLEGGGGSGICYPFFRLAPCYFSCLSSSCCWRCLLLFCFFIVSFAFAASSSSKDKEEMKN